MGQRPARAGRRLAGCPLSSPAAVIFDLDGVLIASETAWDEARRGLVERSGGTWRQEATRVMMGMSSVERSRYLRDELGVPMTAEEISRAVVVSLEQRYRAVEDSSNGLRSAAAARLGVVAIPNAAFPPDPDAVALAGAVLGSIEELVPQVVEDAAPPR